MKKIFNKILIRILQYAKNILMSNQSLRNAVLDVFNKTEFTNLFEHEKMLTDVVRISAYREAIDRQIQPDDLVVDLGTGSGILALFAAQNRPRKVYAIDHSDFIEVAREIAAKKPEFPIQFEQINSRSFTPAEKLDVILHEQIGDDLFEENMVENILDLKKRILKKTGRILPGKFELYLEPFCLKPGYQVPFLWENHFCGIDFGFLKESQLIEKYKPDAYRSRFLEPCSVDYLLCTPRPVLTFDLNDKNFVPDFKIERQTKTIERAGIMDGVCLYFKTIFDEKVSFDTSPLNGKSSWGNRFFRTERESYKTGETISFDLKMENYLSPETWELDFRKPEPVLPEILTGS